MGSLNMYTNVRWRRHVDNEERKLMRQGILDSLRHLYWAPMEPVKTLVGSVAVSIQKNLPRAL